MRTVLTLTFLAFIVAPASAQESALSFEATTHDFGTIRQGVEARHAFVFRNAGDAPLRLTEVKPSCGCTTPHWTRSSVAPGDTGRVTAVFDSEGRSGRFSKTIRVEADDGQATLTIQGQVEPPPIEGGTRIGGLLVERQTVDLGAIPAGERGRATVRIQNVSEQPIQFTDTDTPSNMVSAYVPSDPLFVDDMDEITVLARAYGMTAGDSLSYPITLTTDDEAQPKKVIRVKGRIISQDRAESKR
ncbi:MAG: hypothetical protein BRD45_01015 [Bacteroidetes bacterium QS_8_64_10]|nr:MAG: hypothetical protein BRD45_01015 [Bacteroidetes bacterium QS_8_64_10]